MRSVLRWIVLFFYECYPLAELKCSYNDIQKVAHVVDFQ